MIENNHSFSLENLKILHFCNNFFELNYLESFENKKVAYNGKLLMNDHLDLFYSPLLKGIAETFQVDS